MERNGKTHLRFSRETIKERKLQPVHAAVSAIILLFSVARPEYGLIWFSAWALCWYGLMFIFVYPEEIRRVATIITTFRFLLFAAGAMLGLFLLPDRSFVPLLFFAAAGFTDFFDGLVARKTGVTDAGGFFDGETDALAVSILSLYALGAGHAPPIVLLAGLMRFIFFFPLKRFGKIESSSRYFKLYAKFACAAAVALLAASSAPIWTNRTAFWLPTLILLGLSFLWEIILSIVANHEKSAGKPEIIGIAALVVLYAGLGTYRWVPEYNWRFIFFPTLEFIAIIVILNYTSRLSKGVRKVVLIPVSILTGAALLFSMAEAFMRHTFSQPFILRVDIPYLKPLIEMTVGNGISNTALAAGVFLIVLFSAAAAYWVLRRGLSFSARNPRTAAVLPLILIPAALIVTGDSPLYVRMIAQIQKPKPIINPVEPIPETFPAEKKTEETYSLPGIKDAHILFGIVESYGNTVFSLPEHRRRVEDFFREYEAVFDRAGVFYASALLDSPTTGGRSWLAEGTLLSGIRLENQAEYDQFLKSDSYSLLTFLESFGYYTVLAAPGTTYLSDEWTSAFHFDEFLIKGDFGYNGPVLSFGTMPDQYLMNFVRSYIDGRDSPQPLFLQVLLTTSHTPFDVVPAYIDNWSDLGDGMVYNELEHRYYDNGWLRGSEYPEGYTDSIKYSLKAAADYILQFMEEGEIVFVLGDHQPRLPVRETGAGSEVPLHLFAKEMELLKPWLEAGFTQELLLSAEAPIFGMEALFPLFREVAVGNKAAGAMDGLVPK